MKKLTHITILFIFFPLLLSCEKSFLDIKRDKTHVIPTTLSDYQSLLDNISVFNLRAGYHLNVIGADEYYVEDGVWDLLSSPTQKNAYIWESDVYEGEDSDSWNIGYERILYTNIVLDGLQRTNFDDSERALWSTVQGSALFLRAYSLYQLAQTFASPYIPNASHNTLGVPIRLEADITRPVNRATLEETYQQIIQDLKSAVRLLPLSVKNKFRPNRQAAYGLLSKINMHTENYADAFVYADSCIMFSEGLLDYNTLDATLRYPFSGNMYGEGNPEVLYTELVPGQTIVNSSRFCIDPELYNLYENSDIRKALFFFPTRGTYTFKGSYTGSYNFFGGLALDEMVLNKIECFVRIGDVEKAMDLLNYFLKNRYKITDFIPLKSLNEDEMLIRVIEERRKQLLCRGTRWEDLRRFNKEERFKTNVTRTLKGRTYRLLPNDWKYTWPIPNIVILMSEIPQNPR